MTAWSFLLLTAVIIFVLKQSPKITHTSIPPVLDVNEERMIQERILEDLKNPKYFINISQIMPLKRTLKWIVVTSIQTPTEDITRLAAYPDWTLVVVGDSKTPTNWGLPDVHFLSLETQNALHFASVSRLPTNSYTRKNAGYLYAIANGAQWIYDTDDDNQPYGKGLDQFEFALDRTRGLRFTTREGMNGIQDSLFNPYRHFGRPDMWPRGFPLEFIKNHDHAEGSFRLCRVQRPPAVQQGIVQRDPDVDAVYRLLHADPTKGLDDSFSNIAPPVILAPGTYAPWNSQNTLFSRSAFFGLFLPTTVAFRVTDIWRSYFTQALLHAAGESIAFVPVNAIQRRNAHDYLKDFDEEHDVYRKSGEIVRLIDEWKCAFDTMDKCAIELARQFANRGFWGAEDADIVVHWVKDLQMIGYVFPPLRRGAREEYSIGEDQDVRRNCRRAHLSFAIDLSMEKNEPTVRAAAKISDFADLKDWCDASSSNKSDEWFFPSDERHARATLQNTTLVDNYKTVAIITNNWPWSTGMGLLQRMYEANFAMLIFCGHFPESNEHSMGMTADDSLYPNLKRPINYIDLSDEEVHEGYLMYYCLAKVEEMKIQNVRGYVMFSDDMVYNLWNPFNRSIYQAMRRGGGGSGPWWADRKYGFNAMKRTIHLFTAKYQNDSEVVQFIGDLKRALSENDSAGGKPHQYLMEGDGWANGDWMYIPASNITFVAMFAQLAHEGKLFHEIFASKLLQLLPSARAPNQPRIASLWDEDRSRWSQNYDETLVGLHPVKLSEFKKKAERAKFCDVVLDKFFLNIFRWNRQTDVRLLKD